MYRQVSNVARRSCDLVCRVALVLAASVCATACTSGNEAHAPVNVQSGKHDAGVVSEPDSALLSPMSEITLHVVGLLGTGLTLRLGQNEDYSVHADGTYNVMLGSAVLDVNQLVLSQPVSPAQSCALARLDQATYGITCTATKYQVSGTVEGLEGTGLVLTNQSGETLAIAASGQFQFAALLDDHSAYSVNVAGSVTGPRQLCAVSHGAGTIDGADVLDVRITCATNTYVITSNVVGLTESGLQIGAGPGRVLAIPRAGTFTYAMPFPDGYAYTIEILQQPTSGIQRCYVQDGHAQIDGADATINIICDALNGLRIAEVGSCPFSNSSCWFEVINENPNQLAEQLSLYKVRTTALGPKAFEKSHVFTLPPLTIPYLGRAVVQAASDHGLPDGSNVVHVADGSVLPWWSSDGFVELLHGDNITTDFVRFGKNSTEPLIGGTFTTDATGSAAQGLPTGEKAYGYSIAHGQKSVAVSSPDDWALHAFSTFGGLNDVTTDVDADADGIPDTAEVSGATFSGIDVYSMGARLGQKDVFVEVDRMDALDTAVIPRKEALDKLVSVFKARGIAMHFDVGSVFSSLFDPASYNLGGGNVVPFSKGIGLGASSDNSVADLYALKALNMVAARRGFFYYQLFAWSQQSDGSGGSSGIGELLGNDSIITLGGYNPPLSTATKIQTNLVINYQAATMMHELGHNLGLQHGGADDINRKPNYVSVMNYLYSPLGLPTIGTATEGDRYDLSEGCWLVSLQQLTNAPTGDVSKFVIDYSDGLSADIDEKGLLEPEGLGRVNSTDVDYNCNGEVDPKYSRDLNLDQALDLLVDHDDWASVNFIFRRTWSGSENGPALQFLNPGLHNDVATADAQHKVDRPCGQLDDELLLSAK